MDERMLKAGGEPKRRDLLGLTMGGAGASAGTPVIKK